MNDGKLVGVINNAEGKYYITVSFLNENVANDAFYNIATVFIKEGEHSINPIVPGGDGKIEYKTVDNGIYELTWNSPVYENEILINRTDQISYLVYYAKNKNTQMFSTCAMSLAASKGETELLGSIKGETLIDVEIQKDGVINIMAYMPFETNELYRYLPYDPTPISIDEIGHNPFNYLWFWILLGLLIISVMIGLIIYKVLKRTKQKLDYEMTDVRNVAGMSAEQIDRENMPVLKDYEPLSIESTIN